MSTYACQSSIVCRRSSSDRWPPVAGGSYSTKVMVSLVTPGWVAPPLSAPLGQGTTHGGAYRSGIRTRPVARSQFGLLSAASLPMPGNAPAAGAAAGPVVVAVVAEVAPAAAGRVP